MRRICILVSVLCLLPLEAFSYTTLQQTTSNHLSNRKWRIIPQPTTTSLLAAESDERGTTSVLEKLKSLNVSSQKIRATESPQPELTYEDPAVTSLQKEDTTIVKDFLPTFVLLWVVALLSSLDRVAMSVAILPISSEYHFTDTIKGEISSVFSLGYGLGVIPFGLIAAFVSPRNIMAFGVTLWSLATLGTPIAASFIQVTEQANSIDALTLSAASAVFIATNTAPLLLTRAVMGGAESVVMPANQKFLANWVPKSKKTIAVATVYSGFQVGTVSAYLLSPWVIDNLGGWRGLFYVYGAVGALWLIPWAIWSKDAPGKLAESSLNEDDVIDVYPAMSMNLKIEDDIMDKPSAIDEAIAVVKDAPWQGFAKSKAVWGMIIAHAASNWGFYNLLSWTPSFFAEEYNLNVKDSALFSVFPSLAAAVCGLSAGFLADKFISAMDSDDADDLRTNVRKAFQGLALLGPAVCLLVLSNHIPENPSVAQALLMGTAGLQAMNAAGFGAAPQEKAGEKWAGLLYSITTLPGVVFGSCGVYVTGQVLDLTNQNWSQVYSINAGVDVLGALAFIALYDSKQEFD